MNETEDSPETGSYMERDKVYELAKEQALAMMRQGFHLGGGSYPGRDELHERRPENCGDSAPSPADEAPK